MSKTQEQQKAGLLDDYIKDLKTVKVHLLSLDDADLIAKYDAITSQKPLTADPYADEIFSKRVYNLLVAHFWGDATELRLSECPKISHIRDDIGFGRKSREEYISIMKQYGFNDKI